MISGIALFALIFQPVPGSVAEPRSAELQAAMQKLSKALSNGRFNTAIDKDGQLLKCEIKKSTGDKELDGVFCETVETCGREAGSDMRAVGACMDRKQAEVFERIAAQRLTATNH